MAESNPKPRVLIADDEHVIADTLAAILNNGGFEARAMYSCVHAVEVAPSFRPDLLVFDVLMDEMSGIEAAVRIRALLPKVHVFLLSGQTATPEMLARDKADGYGFEVLTKPVHPRELINRLRESLAA